MSIERRRKHLLKTYGITLEEYAQMLAHQGGACAGCKKPIEHFSRPLHVDHDHSSKLVRGLLCWTCNSLLPVRKDLKEVLTNLLNYLIRPPAVDVIGYRYVPKKKRK